MQILDLNLASKPFRNNSLLWSGYAAALVLLVVASVWNVRTFADHQRLLADLQSDVGTFQSQRLELQSRAQRARAGIESFDLKSLRVQAQKANEVIDWKAFSWTRLFNQMERIQPNQVRMNSIRPLFRAAQRVTGDTAGETSMAAMPVVIEGTARSYGEFAELEHALQSDPHFGRVEPERLTRVDSGEVVFQLRFFYTPQLDEVDSLEFDGTAAYIDVPEDGDDSGEPAESDAASEPLQPAAGEAQVTAVPQDGAAADAPVEVTEPWAGVPAGSADAARSAAPRRTPVERPTERNPALRERARRPGPAGQSREAPRGEGER